MTAREVVRKIKANGGRFIRQVGSHAAYRCRCERYQTTVAMHTGDLPNGTLRAIERDLEPCFGKGWLR